jgi:hypothetical protein
VNHPCPRFEPELSAYLDGETSAALAAEIDEHLRGCDACRAAVAQLRDVSRTLRRWDAHETRYAASTGFRNRVFAKVGADGVAPRSDVVWRIAAAAALVAVGAGGFALVVPRLRPDEHAQYEALAEEVGALKAALREPRAAAPGRASDPFVQETTPLARPEPLGRVVAAPDSADAPPAPQPVAEIWEQRGDERFLREALPEHDTYTRERRILALEEQAQKMQAALAGKQGRETSAPAAPPSPLATFLGELRVAETNFSPYEQVQVWPIELVGPRSADRSRAVPCADAIAQEILAVTEGASRESVVAVNNDAKRSVLVLAGDVLAGGKQDRVAREDVLVAPGQRLSIPTYTCGRERERTSYVTFRHSDGLATPDLRAMVAADQALLSGGVGQDQFDDAVSRTVKALASTSRLGSLDNLYSNPQLSDAAERLMKKFEKRLEGPSVVGFAFAAGSQILGVDVFGDHATFVDHRARVLRSYVMAAIAMDRPEGVPPARSVVADVVAAAPKSAFHADAASGSGTLSVFRGADGGAFGFGILDTTRVVHAVLFTSVPAGVDATAARGGRRNPGDVTPPLDGGGHGSGSSSRGNSGEGGGVEAK